MLNFRKLFSMIIITLSILVISLLFGQLLGGYYIYNLLIGDNPTVETSPQVSPVEKKKVLRLEPAKFYTLQLGIFSEAKSTQDIINKLVEAGLRPFVSSGPPYKVWLGCFSEQASGNPLTDVLIKKGFDAFISEGLINDRALKFPGDNIYMQNSFAPLLGDYSLILNHSLKMFKSPQVSVYEASLWQDMITKIQNEINNAVLKTNKILELQESLNYLEELTFLKEKAITYGNSLNTIIEIKRDEAVLQSQGHLLELIVVYHNLIEIVNNKIDTD